jgi:hypothetical protein
MLKEPGFMQTRFVCVTQADAPVFRPEYGCIRIYAQRLELEQMGDNTGTEKYWVSHIIKKIRP